VDLIKQLILNRDANEYCRGQAIEALALIVAWNERSREEVVDYFGWLARQGLEREPNHAWDCLACACADIEAVSVFDDLRKAGREGFLDPTVMEPEELDEVEAAPRGSQISSFRQHHGPFKDIAKETAWWSSFAKSRRAPAAFGSGTGAKSEPDEYAEPKPYIAPPKIGRNEPCPCGSGKKYKKCCGA
jgi:hypothetical protein